MWPHVTVNLPALKNNSGPAYLDITFAAHSAAALYYDVENTTCYNCNGLSWYIFPQVKHNCYSVCNIYVQYCM